MTANERQLDQIRKILRDAEAYGRAQDAYAKDKNLPRPVHDVVLEPLVPYVRGEQPVIFRADREAEIRGAIKFAEEMKLKPIILGGNDAWKVAGLLKEKNVPVIFTGIFSLPVAKTTLTTRSMKSGETSAGRRAFLHFYRRQRTGSAKPGAVCRHGGSFRTLQGRRNEGSDALSCPNTECG